MVMFKEARNILLKCENYANSMNKVTKNTKMLQALFLKTCHENLS